ncbi:MAG: nuclear transport factor 2 family protein [Acidobacteria bacterium]|nr:nuclear transport factor 2 family protein [Acidobacteriota bacterium]
MKQNLMLVVMMMLISISALSQDQKTTSGSKVEQQILVLDKEWADASLRSDASAFDRLFDENIVVTAGNGEVRNKAQEISDSIPKNPNNKVTSFVTEDVRVRVYGDAAVVTGLAKWTVSMGGREANSERRYMSVYGKRKGAWRMVALHVSRPPGQQMRQPSPQPTQ